MVKMEIYAVMQSTSQQVLSFQLFKCKKMNKKIRWHWRWINGFCSQRSFPDFNSIENSKATTPNAKLDEFSLIENSKKTTFACFERDHIFNVKRSLSINENVYDNSKSFKNYF